MNEATPNYNEHSKIELSCVTFGREIDKSTSFQILNYAFSEGIRFLDTAAAYASGASESVIGEWLSSRRPDMSAVTVCTIS